MKSRRTTKKLLIIMVIALLLPLASICIPEKTTVNAISVETMRETLKKPDSKSTEGTTEAANDSKSVNNNFSVSMDKDGNLNTSFDNAKKDQDLWNWLYGKGHYIVAGISGILAIVSLVFFILCISKFQASGISGQASMRNGAIIGMIVCGVGVALLGSASLIFSLFWNFLK